MKKPKIQCEHCSYFISFYYSPKKVAGNYVVCWHFGYTCKPPFYLHDCRFFMPKKFPSVKDWKKYVALWNKGDK